MRGLVSFPFRVNPWTREPCMELAQAPQAPQRVNNITNATVDLLHDYCQGAEHVTPGVRATSESDQSRHDHLNCIYTTISYIQDFLEVLSEEQNFPIYDDVP